MKSPVCRIESSNHGIFLPDAGICIDGSGVRSPSGSVDIFISHAHADHVPRSKKRQVYATPATAALMRARGHTGTILEIPFGDPVEFPNARVTLYPAGHILGSAMIFVESDAGSVLYTGDCRTPPSPVTEGFKLPGRPVDTLIIEATFGLPIFKWPPTEELFKEIRRFALEALVDGDIPVFICYNLGKAQEVMHALARNTRTDDCLTNEDSVHAYGVSNEVTTTVIPIVSDQTGAAEHPFTIQIHEAGELLCSIYEQFGVHLGTWEPFDRNTCQGKVLIMPSQAMKSEPLMQIKNKRIAYVSGWASLESRASQMGADANIPLSDHLDFFELTKLCRTIRPGNILLTHSPNPEVAIHFLKEEGFAASSLDLMTQP